MQHLLQWIDEDITADVANSSMNQANGSYQYGWLNMHFGKNWHSVADE